MLGMILAAGLGTRLKPFTDTKPKALFEINGKPLIHYAIEKLKKHGFDKIIINVHHFPDKIISYLKESDYSDTEIIISDEREELLDTGGGIKNIINLIRVDEPILIYNVDILTNLNLEDLFQNHIKDRSLITLAVSNRKSSRYFLFNETFELCGWRNVNTGQEKIVKNSSSTLKEFAFSGIHVLSPEVFRLMPEENKYSIVDFYLSIAANENIIGFDHSDSKLIDVGKSDSVPEAEKFLAEYY